MEEIYLMCLNLYYLVTRNVERAKQLKKSIPSWAGSIILLKSSADRIIETTKYRIRDIHFAAKRSMLRLPLALYDSRRMHPRDRHSSARSSPKESILFLFIR